MNTNHSLIELHLHIDGAISVETALVLAQMQSTTLPSENKNELFHLLSAPDNCQDLNEYLKRFALPCSLMQTAETISEAVYRVQEELKENGVIYAELRFAPQLHTNLGMTQEDVVLATIEGLNRSTLQSNLILCCMRDKDNDKENLETIRLADVYRNKGIVAVDLAGAEGLYPTSDFKQLFDYAQELDLNITIHAGEAAGPESIKSAIKFGAKRIGHGVHAIEDSSLMDELEHRQIALELCITSNLQTKAIQDINAYPLRTFMNHNIPITLNTDNPVVSNTTLQKEFQLARRQFQLTNQEIAQLLINAANHSFADTATKTELEEYIKKRFSQ